jgi:dolichol-phosphate mannosyltransferase
MIMRTLTIIPTYNEKENIAQAVRGVLACSDSDVLVIDDGSPDGTAAVVRTLCVESGSRVRLLERPRKSGLGSAYREGFRIAASEGYGAVCEMDADGSLSSYAHRAGS